MKSGTEHDYRERLARVVSVVLAAPAGSRSRASRGFPTLPRFAFVDLRCAPPFPFRLRLLFKGGRYRSRLAVILAKSLREHRPAPAAYGQLQAVLENNL
jgi:hypothetical protein